MSGYRAGDIIRWVFTKDDGAIGSYGEHLLLLSNDYSNDYFNVLELETGIRTDEDWLVRCGGGYWEKVA